MGGQKGGRPAPFAMSNMVGQEDNRMNNRTMFPSLKNNADAAYKGPVKIELLEGAGLLAKRGEGSWLPGYIGRF